MPSNPELLAEVARLRALLRRCMRGVEPIDLGDGEVIGLFLRSPAETLPDKDAWPNGCHDPDSCVSHGRCMYLKCRYEAIDIKAMVKVAKEAKNDY